MLKTIKTPMCYAMLGLLWALPVTAQDAMPPLPDAPSAADVSLPDMNAAPILPDEPGDALAAQLNEMEGVSPITPDVPAAPIANAAPVQDIPLPDLPPVAELPEPAAEVAPATPVAAAVPAKPATPVPAAPKVTAAAETPALPEFPANDMFDPANPFAVPPPSSIDPIAAKPVPDAKGQSASTLPLPGDQETFDFFQSGRQIRDEGVDPAAHLLPQEPVKVEEPVKEVRRAPPPKPKLNRSFNYRNQILPAEIYKKQYGNENRHLPVARWESEYDALTFNAAARNDVNGLRALLESGRNRFMVNANGETLAAVAARHSAHATLRYLLAKGVSPNTHDVNGTSPLQLSESRRDIRSQAALRAAGAY